MSRNIKEIGKELLGKSLNSFHRKTGLTQLEKNNEMQDGILDGILSQVDDAYIEKTEQSNVIHLDGSGDGVVVLDGIEGNTMVNLTKTLGTIATTNYSTFYLKGYSNSVNLVAGKTYTVVPLNFPSSITDFYYGEGNGLIYGLHWGKIGIKSFVCSEEFSKSTVITPHFRTLNTSTTIDISELNNINIMLLEGDYTNKEINYFEGLQSSFEENKEDDKYKIEILSNNKNLCPPLLYGGINASGQIISSTTDMYSEFVELKENTRYICSNNGTLRSTWINYYDKDKNFIKRSDNSSANFITPNGIKYARFCGASNDREKFQVELGTKVTSYIPHKSNKIKLLLDEPLRDKDKLCIKDGKIVVERNSKQSLLDGNLNWTVNNSDNEGIYSISTTDLVGVPKGFIISDKLPTTTTTKNEGVMLGITTGKVMVCIDRNKLTNTTLNGMKQYLNENPMQVVFDIETYYEEVLNEYGEPILLEGYENGTIYIDSTIIPTTTVRYTPKMESFKTLKEVENNNIMLTNDVNDNIIPYMMDVDLMIMEKEMALMSHKNIRTIGVKDMTSMQKRTQDMLERLIKGKTLTEQECKTRITTYLNAGKITDAQAEELNFLIDEIYA